MKVIVVTNRKGGVGKSAIATHVSVALSQKGRVLHIDLDDQGDSSRPLSAFDSGLVASAFFNEQIENVAFPETDKPISLIAGDIALEKVQGKTADDLAPCWPFVKRMNAIRESKEFDYCVIDTPPGAGVRMKAGLLVADYVLSPIELKGESLNGVRRLVGEIKTMQQANKRLEFLGMLPNRFKRSTSQLKFLRELIAGFSQQVIPHKISDRICVHDALIIQKTVWELPRTEMVSAAVEEFDQAFEHIFKKMGI